MSVSFIVTVVGPTIVAHDANDRHATVNADVLASMQFVALSITGLIPRRTCTEEHN